MPFRALARRQRTSALRLPAIYNLPPTHYDGRMPLDLLHVSLVAAITFAACLLQGMIGFGAGLLAIPLLVLAGLPVPQAIGVNVVTSAIQSAWGAYRLRNDLVIGDTWRPILLRLLVLPLGVLTLWWLDELDPQLVKQLLGGMILAIVIVQWVWRVEPRDHLHPGWEWLAFPIGGWMLGFCGMGGPPMVLWVMAHRWSNFRSRAFLFFVFFTGTVPHALCLWLIMGNEVLIGFLLGAVSLPFAWLGTSVGLRLGAQLPKARLRSISYMLLVLIALSAMAQPLIQSRLSQ